jgi:hypothetical protein
MKGLRDETLRDLYRILAECEEFASHGSLLSLFVGEELSPYRNRLPEVINIQERTHLTVDYLLRQRKDAGGRWVILNFLQTLSNRYEHPHGKRGELDQILNTITEELQDFFDGIEIPFVTLAMNKEEANELLHDPNFKTLEGLEEAGFKNFINELKGNENDLLSHYETLRDHWKPYHVEDEDTRIESQVQGLLEDINLTRQRMRLPQVYATFYTQGFFDRDLAIWDLLYDRGCISIADFISLLHPSIWNAYDSSTIRNRKEKAAMIVLTPDLAFKTPLSDYIEEFFKTRMQWQYMEFEYRLLRLYELNVGNLRTFKRRLFMLVPEAIRILQNLEPDPETLASLQKRQKTSIGNHIFGVRR